MSFMFNPRKMKRFFVIVILMVTNFLATAQSKKKLPSPINSPESIEYAPSISADGRTLIYQSDQYGKFVNSIKKVPTVSADGKTAAFKDEYETTFYGIYESKLHPSGQWLAPQEITPINKYGFGNMTPTVGGPTISYDGNLLFFYANYDKNTEGKEDIYFSRRDKSGWSQPSNIGKPINTSGYEGFPSISPDGKRLYFTREMPGKFAGTNQCYKIMVSEKSRTGQWRAPFELPAPVNGKCEKAPRIMPDGKTLVFSSIREGSRGDFDFYKSVLQENASWSEPESLGFVNSKKSDVFVAMNPCGDMMYYVSDGDIFTTEIPLALRPKKMLTVQGYILDTLSGQSISAKVTVKDKSSEEILMTLDNNASDGRYTALLPYGSSYSLTVNLPQYKTKILSVTADLNGDCNILSLNIPLSKITQENTLARTENQVINEAPTVTNDNPKQIQTKPRAIEELELVAETPNDEKVKIEAKGEKKIEEKTITQYALILRVVNKESEEPIANAQLTLKLQEGDAIDRTIEKNGNELIAKALPGEKLAITISAPGFLPFESKLPEFTQDRRVTIKLAPLLRSFVNIEVSDAANDKSLEADCEIIYTKENKTEKLKTQNGKLRFEIFKNETINIKATALTFESLTKTVEIDIPKEGSKQYDVQLKLSKNEYFLNLEALDIETGKVIADAVFYIFNQSGEKIMELIADQNGKLRVQLPDNGNYKIQILADGFNTTSQNLDKALNENTVKFKVVPTKKKTHEIKVNVFDSITGEEVFINAKIDNVVNQKTPFFLVGEADQSFKIITSGEGYIDQTHQITLVDSLMKRVSTRIYVSKGNYNFDFRIFDIESQQPIYRSTFSIINLETKQEMAKLGKDGFYTANFNPNNTYTIIINQSGYEPFSQKIKGDLWIKEGSFERDFFIKKHKTDNGIKEPTNITNTTLVSSIETKAFGKIEKGKTIVLNNIFFDQSSPVLRPESFEELKKLESLLKENPKVFVLIKGHTDNVGDFYLNVKLSKDRCQSVSDYLAKNGIDSKRIKTNGRGSMEPVAPNDTEENKKKNRRVEFVLDF